MGWGEAHRDSGPRALHRRAAGGAASGTLATCPDSALAASPQPLGGAGGLRSYLSSSRFAGTLIASYSDSRGGLRPGSWAAEWEL